jgi:hypothetical protein
MTITLFLMFVRAGVLLLVGTLGLDALVPQRMYIIATNHDLVDCESMLKPQDVALLLCRGNRDMMHRKSMLTTAQSSTSHHHRHHRAQEASGYHISSEEMRSRDRMETCQPCAHTERFCNNLCSLKALQLTVTQIAQRAPQCLKQAQT